MSESNDVGNNVECFFCGQIHAAMFFTKGDLVFVRCPTCGSVYNTQPTNQEDYLTGSFNKGYRETLKDYLCIDWIHNKRLRTESRLKEVLGREVCVLYSFGGGYPKIESFFNPAEILVYDACANGYEQNIELFSALYGYDSRRIVYANLLFSSKNIPMETQHSSVNDIIAFVHILEHFPAEEVMKIIDACPRETPIFIYQPNGAKIRNNWHHMCEQHVFIPTCRFFTHKLAELYPNAEFHLVQEWDEDFILMFTKH